MDIKFNSVEELYNRLIPALRCKSREFAKNDHSYISKTDIWNYLKKTKWTKVNDLNLYEMINDIMEITHEELDEHIKENYKKAKREPIITEGENNEEK